MSAYKDEILNWLKAHESEMISDISKLIRINSEKMPAEPGKPYGAGPAAALELALKIAGSYGFAVKNYDNYVGCADFNDKEQQLDILAHLDVVPVEPERWTVTAPFEPVIKDGCLYGRGSSDDKGPAMAALYAMRAVKELGIPLSKNVRLILGTDEECGSSDIAYYYSKENEAPMTFSPDAEFPVINLEKGHFVGEITGNSDADAKAGITVESISCGSKFNVIPGDCSIVLKGAELSDIQTLEPLADKLGVTLLTEAGENLTLKVSGKSGHAASPEAANNALTAALCLLSQLPLSNGQSIRRLSQLFPHGDYAGEAAKVKLSDQISGSLTLSLNMMTFDCEGFKTTFDIRFPVCGNRENIIDVLKDNLKAVGFDLNVVSWSEPHYVPEDTPFIKALLESYEAFKGKPGTCMAIGGGTYVHQLKNGVAFGPVELDTQTNLHGNDENIPVEELIVAAAIYAEAIILLCS